MRRRSERGRVPRPGDGVQVDGPERPARRAFLYASAAASVGLWLGCGGDDAPADLDAGRGDGGPRDAGVLDAAGPDAELPDARPRDAGPEPVDPPEPVPESMLFPLSVAAGDVTREAAICWTRYDGSAPLSLVVWQMAGEVYERTVFHQEVGPADGGFVHVDVGGLAAGARHRYAFFELAAGERVARSPIGRFRAAIAPDAMEPLVFGACSCTRNGRSMATLERAGARSDLDAFLHVGDTTYNDGARTVAEYRARWAENLGTAGYRAVRSSTGSYATWDDHEVDDDYDPERVPADQLAAARQTFFEAQPLRRDPASPDRVWKSFRWGRTAEVFVLDCRSERLPSTRSGSAPIYVSRAQLDWLKAGLLESQAVFKLVVTSVPITDFPGLFDFAAADRWEGYAAQREELLRHVDDNAIGGVLWVAGDFHLASMGRVSPSGPGATQIEALVGPGAQTGNLLASTLGAPLFDWATGTNNYAALHLDPATREVALWYHDADDAVLQVGRYVL